MSRQPLLLFTLSISSTCRDATKAKPPQPPKENQSRERFSNAAVHYIHPIRAQHTPNIRPTRLIAKKRGCPTRKLRQPSSYRNYRKGRALPLFILEHSLQRHGQEPGRCCCRHSPHQSDCKHQPSSMHCRHRYLHPKESPRDSPYATDG